MTKRISKARDLLALAEAKGYIKGAHTKDDEKRDAQKHVKKTRKDQDNTLNRYIKWHLAHMEREHEERGLPPPTEEMVRGKYLGLGTAAPDLVTVKDFIRYCVATSRPVITDRPTCDSINGTAEWFFAGFTRVTGTATDEGERSEVYNWVRQVLTVEGLVVNVHRPKNNFAVRDLTRVLLTIWQKDDLIYVHERHRVQFTLIIRIYCWTGARLGAFFTDGLRWKDISFVLQRTTADGRWRLIYKIDQRWVKNNRDPTNIVFGTAGHEHDKFIWDDAAFLLNLAMVDKALFGYDKFDDLRAQRIPDGQDEVPLRFHDASLGQPILRKCTKAGGVTDEPMTRASFDSIFSSTLRNAGYLCGTSIHSIRRQLGKKVDEIYTEVQRSQHLTQADPRVFGQSYVANTSSVDGQAAFLGEATEHRHIDYFQGMEKFYQKGLPCILPASINEELWNDPHLKELKGSERASHLKTLKRKALRRHQESWIKDRRDQIILTRGMGQIKIPERTDLVQALCLLFPERERLARTLALGDTLAPEAKWDAMDDLYTLCTQDLSVLYLPHARPLEGRCPTECCSRAMVELPKNERQQHIHACVRRTVASEMERSVMDIHYCYFCFNWIDGLENWNNHCQNHLESLTSKKCGSTFYCHTLIRPAYCPFCIGDERLPASQRLKSWSRDRMLWAHMSKCHLQQVWIPACPHPLCEDQVFVEMSELEHHFIDEHGLIRRSSIQSSRCSEKRKTCGDPAQLQWVVSDTHPRPAKKTRSFDLCSTDEASLFDTMSQDWTNVETTSYDSTLVNSPATDDELFQYIRSPSPDEETWSNVARTIELDDVRATNRQLVETSSEIGSDSSSPCLDCSNSSTDEPAELSKIFIRLKVQPPKPKIILHISQKKKKGAPKCVKPRSRKRKSIRK